MTKPRWQISSRIEAFWISPIHESSTQQKSLIAKSMRNMIDELGELEESCNKHLTSLDEQISGSQEAQ